MIVSTSYFSNWRNFTKDKDIYSIVRVNPKWNKYKNISEFAPSKELLKLYKEDKISEEEYTKMYIDEQSKVNHKSILEELKSDNILLVCYEKTDDFCHRHILLEILNKKGIKIIKEN